MDKRYGFLYARYEREHYYFELVNIAKMFTFMLMRTFLWYDLNLQVPGSRVPSH